MREGWEIRQLGDILIFDKRFNGIPKGQQGTIAHFHHVSAEELKSLKVDGGNVKLISTGQFDGYTTEELAGGHLNRGEIITIPSGGVANIKYYSGSFVDSGNIIGIARDTSICLKYVYYGMTCKNDVINSFYRGVSIKHPFMPDICKITLSIPTTQVQEKIVAELDCLSDVIAKKKQQLEELDKLAQSIFYNMFGDPITNEKGWKVKKLGDLCEVITKGTTPSSLGFSFVEEGINFLKVESFNSDETLNEAKIFHITKECDAALRRSRLEANDILMCIAGATCGRLAIVPSSVIPANTNQAFGIIRLKDKEQSFHRYIYSFLHSSFIRESVNDLMKGVAQPNLTLAHLRGFSILLPPTALQNEFAQKIEAIEKQKELVKQSIVETETLFNYTMDKYFG